MLTAFRSRLVLALALGVMAIPALSASNGGGTVTFNTKTYKYHNPGCSSAIRCTVNCTDVTLAEAQKMSGVPCKKCHGRPSK